MLRDRYEFDVRFWNMIHDLAIEMDPELAQIDRILEDDELFRMVKNDLAKHHPKTLVTGRNSTPVEVILRMLVVKRLYGFSYERTERHVSDSLVLRWFCRVYFNPVLDHSNLNRWALLIKPETLAVFNDRIRAIATALKVTRGRKLRTDGTVVETCVHYPSDSSLLADGVRVLSRVIKRAKQIVVEQTTVVAETFRDRTRSARNQSRRIANQTRRKGEEAKTNVKTAYRQLVRVTRASVAQAKTVLELLKETGTCQVNKLTDSLQIFIPWVEQVIDQTVRRVFEDEAVPAAQKIVSIFEPHTNIIRRNKVGKPTEFGHKVWLDEVEGGIVTQWRVLDGNPPDRDQWQPSLAHHVRQFGRPPDQASGDRGVYSPENEVHARRIGVKRIILPKPGWKSEARRQHEHQRWFKRGRHFHAGVEGRISVLKRKHDLDRCPNHGEDGFERWVAWGVIAGNLAVMGATLAAR